MRLFYSVKDENDLLHIDELKENLEEYLNVFITREKTSNYTNRRMQIEDF